MERSRGHAAARDPDHGIAPAVEEHVLRGTGRWDHEIDPKGGQMLLLETSRRLSLPE